LYLPCPPSWRVKLGKRCCQAATRLREHQAETQIGLGQDRLELRSLFVHAGVLHVGLPVVFHAVPLALPDHMESRLKSGAQTLGIPKTSNGFRDSISVNCRKSPSLKVMFLPLQIIVRFLLCRLKTPSPAG
jgi:hypothetical protein